MKHPVFQTDENSGIQGSLTIIKDGKDKSKALLMALAGDVKLVRGTVSVYTHRSGGIDRKFTLMTNGSQICYRGSNYECEDGFISYIGPANPDSEMELRRLMPSSKVLEQKLGFQAARSTGEK